MTKKEKIIKSILEIQNNLDFGIMYKKNQLEEMDFSMLKEIFNDCLNDFND